MTETQADAPEKKSSFGCLKMLVIAAAFVAIILLIFGIMVWNAISWVQNSPEPKMASYPPLQLSPGEKEDVTRVLNELGAATQTGTDVDEYVTPQVFNGAIEKLMEDEKKKKTAKPDAPVNFRAAFAERGFDVMLTVPASDQKTKEITPNMYVNADVVFDLEIANGQIAELEIIKMTLHDRPAPVLARIVYSRFSEALKSNQQNNADFGVIKTLKREGERVHIVLDGKKLKEQEDRKKSASNPNFTAPKPNALKEEKLKDAEKD